jgi:hypothetical protein
MPVFYVAKTIFQLPGWTISIIERTGKSIMHSPALIALVRKILIQPGSSILYREGRDMKMKKVRKKVIATGTRIFVWGKLCLVCEKLAT